MGLNKIRKAIKIIDVKYLRFKASKCPLHGVSIFVRLNNSMLGVRCMRCGASPIATSIANVLVRCEPYYRQKRIYELSANGPFPRFLSKNVENIIFSEYLEDAQPGKIYNGVLCQDVQRLTFSNAQFDICTSTEVFEHVPDDAKGFKEVFRVLKENGVFIFTVPLHDVETTVERAVLEGDEVRYLLRPVFHDDSIRGEGRVLVFRDYGRDIVDRLLRAGFAHVEIVREYDSGGFGYSKDVVIARKTGKQERKRPA